MAIELTGLARRVGDREVMPLTVSTHEAATLLGLNVLTIRKYARIGRIASVVLGRRRLIPTSELKRLIAENTRQATAA